MRQLKGLSWLLKTVLVLVLIGIVLALVLAFWGKGDPLTWLTAVLVIVTAYYAGQTRLTVREMREERADAVRREAGTRMAPAVRLLRVLDPDAPALHNPFVPRHLHEDDVRAITAQWDESGRADLLSLLVSWPTSDGRAAALDLDKKLAALAGASWSRAQDTRMRLSVTMGGGDPGEKDLQVYEDAKARYADAVKAAERLAQCIRGEADPQATLADLLMPMDLIGRRDVSEAGQDGAGDVEPR